MAGNSIWVEQLRRVQDMQRQVGTQATLARSLHKFQSLGYGSFRLPSSFDFQVTFTEEPLVTTGVALVPGSPIPSPDLAPTVTVGVWAWKRQGNLYVGANIWITVSQPVAGGYKSLVEQDTRWMDKLKLNHHLSFEGMAIRAVDYDAIME